ncbi:peptidylprolyl isomerase [Anatilimnocola sp. NA78]|uniref:peptidylprolyl isomerase n=1 Tax=Anatilimnocola sp. NA78 TaxID=3415683 RepID=UPI003CE538A6
MSCLNIRGLLVAALLVVLMTPAVRAQEAPAPVIAATVNGLPISKAELDRALVLVVKERQLTAAQKENLKKEVLSHAVDRRLVLHWLTESKQAASEQDVDLAHARLLKKLEAESITLPKFLEMQGQTAAEFRDQQHWELSWHRFLERYLTAANLQKFFEKNRRDFDGTELHIAHVLLTAPKEAKPVDWEQLNKQASDIRQQVVDKKLTFAEAAKQHSNSPTAKAGGDIGWIKRHEPMPESFSAAAFQLQPGELSPPVETTFGVHLITCLEVKSGTRTWQDAADELRPAVIHYLFRWIADKERATAKLEYTNHWPH